MISDTSWYDTTKDGADSVPSKVRLEDRKDDELRELDGLEAAAAVSRGAVGATEVVDAHLGRIAAVNPSVNDVLARFEGYRGHYVFHCHNLEHEDMMMMANFEVV